MNGLSIRQATPEDYQKVIELYGAFVENQDRYSEVGNDSFSTVLNDKNASLDLGILNGEIVAFIMYSIRFVVRYPKPIVEVEEFFVSKEHRRLGIGKQLMNRVFDFATEKSCQYVFLASGNKRVAAHSFYQDFGFDEYAFHYRKKI